MHSIIKIFLGEIKRQITINYALPLNDYQLGIIKDNHLRFYSAYWRMVRAPEMLIDKVNPL